jgi:hypothetical protein
MRQVYENEFVTPHLPEFRLLYCNKEALIDSLRLILIALPNNGTRDATLVFIEWLWTKFFQTPLPEDVYDLDALFAYLGGDVIETVVDPLT